MLRIRRCSNILNTIRAFNLQKKRNSSFPLMPFSLVQMFSNMFVLSKACATIKMAKSSKDNVQNFDVLLQQACDLGELAIVQVMDVLKDRIIEICEEYNNCLGEQIKIVKEASEQGPMSSRWDDLPQFRSLASELNEELNNYVLILNTLGEAARKQNMDFITKEKHHLYTIEMKFKQVQDLLETHINSIKKLEKTLLDLNRQVILKTK